MGSCVSSTKTDDKSKADTVPQPASEPSTDVAEMAPVKNSQPSALVQYVSWSKRKSSDLLKSTVNVAKKTFVRKPKHPENSETEDAKPQISVTSPTSTDVVKEEPNTSESKPAESKDVHPPKVESKTENEHTLEETVSVFGVGASMKVPSSHGSKDNTSVAGATILERHNVVVVGEGPELLFMSHGFGTNQQIWGGILEHLDLQNKYKVIMWDLMGAYSTNPEGFNFQRYSTLHGYADDLLEVLDELDVESCTYIGHSVSGMIGVIASVERPKVFKRLILIGASARYLDSPGYKGGFTLEQLDQVFAAMQDNYKVWASGFAPMVIGEDVESPHVREFCRSLFLIRPDIAFSTLRTIFTCDLRHLLAQVSVQVHLLQTARDAAVPWDAVQYMLDAFPNACVEMVPVAGHLPHLTHPETVSDAILRHLAMPLRNRKNYEDSNASVASDEVF